MFTSFAHEIQMISDLSLVFYNNIGQLLQFAQIKKNFEKKGISILEL